ncbi:hypothetical protein [Paenimyroides marinum]|nr:hypothetical protein [Paenimyroides aquimaris]
MQHNHHTNRLKTMILLFLILGLLASCDCMQRIQGYAVDAQTGEPLSEVFYSRSTLLTTEEKQYERHDTLHLYQRRTDSTGWFMDWRLANGFNCKPRLVLWLDKEGYEPVRLESNRDKGLDTLIVKLHKKVSH